MSIAPQYYSALYRLKCCVIIPTYNNHKTLKRVIDGVLQYTANIIVVNDGATDTTVEILESYPQITQVHLPKNKGKGNALRTGFTTARTAGYDYAITIDSDGQHFPDDIPVFIDALEKDGEALLIGSRNMAQEGVPKKSSFGNKFSNFWFWFETGIKLEDTQSGYRLYPLNRIPKKYFTPKFEFEIEVIVGAAWKGLPVKNVPVKVLYDMNERVSHFRPFSDFARISILNTVLVIISLLYIKPRDFILSFKKKSLKQFFIENVLESGDSNAKKALSIALGVFIGIAPLWGLQTVLVLSLAYMLRLNKLIAFAFSNISIPPAIPVIIYLSLKMGSLFIADSIVPDKASAFEAIQQNLTQYIVGSIVLATLTALAFGGVSYLILMGLDKNKIHNNA
jgi:glycosyltransferase involved in cell wall biosynthesis